MIKLEAGAVRFNAILTEDLLDLLRKESAYTHNGNASLLLREILIQRYKRKGLMNKSA